ncbi:MAG: ATP-binding protein [Bacteroidota bacterium]
MKDRTNNTYRQIYVVIIVSIIALLATSQWVVQYLLVEQENDSHVINCAGRQRMLSQQIAKLALLAHKNQENIYYRDTLSQLANQFVRVHKGLEFSDDNLKLYAQNSPQTLNLLHQLTPMVSGLSQAASQRISDSTLHTILKYERSFLPIMDNLVAIYDMESSARIHRLHQIELVFAGITMLVLLFEVLLFVRPVLRRSQRHLEKIELLNSDLESQVRLRTRELEATIEDLKGFSYTISHDLKQPIRAITNYASFLKEDYAEQLPTEGQEWLKIILSSSERMADMLKSVLKYSESGHELQQIEMLNMELLFQETFNELIQTDSNHNVSFFLSPLISQRGDKAMLKQIITNLLQNALKYSKDAPQRQIRVDGYWQGDEYIYVVKDNGQGFGESEKDRLFKLFSRLKSGKDVEGSGVGLAICHRLIQKMGGRIWADGEEGKGASFYFTWPLNL